MKRGLEGTCSGSSPKEVLAFLDPGDEPSVLQPRDQAVDPPSIQSEEVGQEPRGEVEQIALAELLAT
jgi:hypothetical protein